MTRGLVLLIRSQTQLDPLVHTARRPAERTRTSPCRRASPQLEQPASQPRSGRLADPRCCWRPSRPWGASAHRGADPGETSDRAVAAAGRAVAALHALPLRDQDPVPLVDAVRLRAEAAARRVPREPGVDEALALLDGGQAFAGASRCWCHRDLQPNTWVWDGQVLGLIDWEHSRPDAPELDLAPLVPTSLWPAFAAAYGAIDRHRLRAAVALYGLVTLAWGVRHEDGASPTAGTPCGPACPAGGVRAAGTLGARCSAQAPPECSQARQAPAAGGPLPSRPRRGSLASREPPPEAAGRLPPPLRGRVRAEPQDFVRRAPEGEHRPLGWRVPPALVRQEARPGPWARPGSWNSPGFRRAMSQSATPTSAARRARKRRR